MSFSLYKILTFSVNISAPTYCQAGLQMEKPRTVTQIKCFKLQEQKPSEVTYYKQKYVNLATFLLY